MGRRVVITGGATGIGRACAVRFLADGDDVVLVGRRAEVLDEARAALEPDAPGRVTVHAADLREPAEVARLAAKLGQGPTVDVLVLNAGGNAPAPDGPAATDEVGRLDRVARAWRDDHDLNVLTTVLPFEALRDHLTTPGARVVAMGSIAGERGGGSYGAAKAAVHAWVWATAPALGSARDHPQRGLPRLRPRHGLLARPDLPRPRPGRVAAGDDPERPGRHPAGGRGGRGPPRLAARRVDDGSAPLRQRPRCSAAADPSADDRPGTADGPAPSRGPGRRTWCCAAPAQ